MAAETNFAIIADNLAANANSYADGAVEARTEYFYQVRVLDGDGKGPSSKPVHVNTDPNATATPRPTPTITPIPTVFEGCKEGKGWVSLRFGLNVLAAIAITVSEKPPTATPVGVASSGASTLPDAEGEI